VQNSLNFKGKPFVGLRARSLSLEGQRVRTLVWLCHFHPCNLKHVCLRASLIKCRCSNPPTPSWSLYTFPWVKLLGPLFVEQKHWNWPLTRLIGWWLQARSEGRGHGWGSAIWMILASRYHPITSLEVGTVVLYTQHHCTPMKVLPKLLGGGQTLAIPT
jgi:hypothetical protein